jgi:hypothetical protein
MPEVHTAACSPHGQVPTAVKASKRAPVHFCFFSRFRQVPSDLWSDSLLFVLWMSNVYHTHATTI